jgi:hypothetical protein
MYDCCQINATIFIELNYNELGLNFNKYNLLSVKIFDKMCKIF